jgi:cytosine/uracil/thiamine/allantoin permease
VRGKAVDCCPAESGRTTWRRYQSGWNPAAIVAFVIAALFSSVLPNIGGLLPSWWSVNGWFFRMAIGGGVYHAVGRAMPSPALRRV